MPNPKGKKYNPKGFNQFNKSKKELKKALTKQEIINSIGEVYHEQWTLKRKVRSLGQDLKRLNKELETADLKNIIREELCQKQK